MGVSPPTEYLLTSGNCIIGIFETKISIGEYLRVSIDDSGKVTLPFYQTILANYNIDINSENAWISQNAFTKEEALKDFFNTTLLLKLPKPYRVYQFLAKY